MTIHSYVKLRRFENNSGKQELGKILEKDLLVMAHSRETPLNDLKNRLCRLS